MRVIEFIDMVKSSELKQLAIKNEDKTLISFINLGMLELYKIFPLKQEEAIITLQEGKTLYSLNGKDPDVDIPSPEEFLIVSSCYDEDGDEVTVNDHTDPVGIMTPSYNTVEVPNVAQGERLSIIYRSSPKFVKYTSDVLELPIQLISCLVNYVVYKGYSTITKSSATQNPTEMKNNMYYSRFKKSCEEVSDYGLIPHDDMELVAFNARGFV